LQARHATTLRWLSDWDRLLEATLPRSPSIDAEILPEKEHCPVSPIRRPSCLPSSTCCTFHIDESCSIRRRSIVSGHELRPWTADLVPSE
jgi:hypothetical protein